MHVKKIRKKLDSQNQARTNSYTVQTALTPLGKYCHYGKGEIQRTWGIGRNETKNQNKFADCDIITKRPLIYKKEEKKKHPTPLHCANSQTKKEIP